MNRRVAFPFFTLSRTAVEADPWLVALGGGKLAEAGDFLADWDYSSAVRLQRRLRINLPIASADLAIPEDELGLAIVTRVGTGPGRLPRLIVDTHRYAIDPADLTATIALHVKGECLSAVLDLFTEVVLTTVPSTRDTLSPKRRGDRLWHDRHRTRLEGEEPRFPIEVVDLRAMLGEITAGSAPWHLHWSPRDWSRDFHGAIRLFLKHDCGELVRRVEDQDTLTLQAIMADVMGQVCERLVMEPDVTDIIERCEPGTVGAQAAAWLRLAWPGRDAAFARSVLENRPGDFRAAFLALAELGDA